MGPSRPPRLSCRPDLYRHRRLCLLPERRAYASPGQRPRPAGRPCSGPAHRFRRPTRPPESPTLGHPHPTHLPGRRPEYPLRCPRCGGIMKIVACIEARQGEVIRTILEHCGLWHDPPPPPGAPRRRRHAHPGQLAWPRSLSPESSPTRSTPTSSNTPTARKLPGESPGATSPICPGNPEPAAEVHYLDLDRPGPGVIMPLTSSGVRGSGGPGVGDGPRACAKPRDGPSA